MKIITRLQSGSGSHIKMVMMRLPTTWECYYNGYGVDEDEQKAIELLIEAAERDNDDALSLLQNIGVNIDHILEEKMLRFRKLFSCMRT